MPAGVLNKSAYPTAWMMTQSRPISQLPQTLVQRYKIWAASLNVQLKPGLSASLAVIDQGISAAVVYTPYELPNLGGDTGGDRLQTIREWLYWNALVSQKGVSKYSAQLQAQFTDPLGAAAAAAPAAAAMALDAGDDGTEASRSDDED